MSCNFKIPFTGDTAAALNKAKSAIEKQGGDFTGDEKGGKFSVSAMGNTIAGSYTAEGNDLVINIDTKPFFISCDMVEGFLKSQLK